jgi:hypothetical protein
MQTVIMISNADITVNDLIKAVTPAYVPTLLDASGFVVNRPRANLTPAYVRVRILDNPSTQFDEDDTVPFPVGSDTRGFLIEFNDLSLLKEVMPLLADRSDVAVDDDHGNIVLGNDFVNGLQQSTMLGWLPDNYET